MISAINYALSALNASEFRLAQSAHDVANINTPQFTSQRALQAEMVPGGTKITSTQINSQAGPLESIGSALAGAEPHFIGDQQLPYGYIEGSNTDLIEETIDQIKSQQAFEANLTTIKTQDELLGSLIDIVS